MNESSGTSEKETERCPKQKCRKKGVVTLESDAGVVQDFCRYHADKMRMLDHWEMKNKDTEVKDALE